LKLKKITLVQLVTLTLLTSSPGWHHALAIISEFGTGVRIT